ncbi:Alb1-domain-containing protein [Xylariaceae sp. FL0255]|nr:Alb1-domain-containing protein [Xylariaceae sp. FL0255]
MAKGAISKKKKALSIHSRAARRATSPGIDTDKSLKNVRAPAESINHRPSVLAIHHGAGVSKKQKNGRAMSSKARKRHEKAQDRAATILERTQNKIDQSKGQSRSIQARRKAWEDINGSIVASTTAADPKLKVERQDDESELDDEMESAQDQREEVSATNIQQVVGQEEEDDQDGIL